MPRTIIILVLTLFILESSHLQAQDWEKRKEEDGVTVYTRAYNGSNFHAFKAVMNVKGDADFVRHVLWNSDEYAHIFPDTEELRILEREGDSYLIQYSRTDAPWPVDDRDGIYELAFTDHKNGGFTTEGNAIPDYLPEKEGAVRIQKSTSFWRVIPVEGGRLRIEYEVAAEPGGNVPDWLANSAVTELPIDTMNNLRELIEEQSH